MWLKDNNPYYKDITINHAALQQLPEDDAPVGLQVMEHEDEEDQDDAGPEATGPDDEEEAGGEPQVSRSFLPLPVRKQKDQGESGQLSMDRIHWLGHHYLGSALTSSKPPAWQPWLSLPCSHMEGVTPPTLAGKAQCLWLTPSSI